MDRRFSRESSLQKRAAENRRKAEHVPDLTDFMNDMFFGTVNNEDKKAYNLRGTTTRTSTEEPDDFDVSTRSNSSKQTEEWLEEARRMVASSSTRCDSPSRLVGSPRFATEPGARFSTSSLDRRDPLSRSARRHRPVEGFGGEILSKSAKHSRNQSESLDAPNSPAADISPAEAVHKWFSNILKSSNLTPPSVDHFPPSPDPPPLALPPRQPTVKKSRFQVDPPANTQGVPVPSHRIFKTQSTLLQDTQFLSPPKNLNESAHRRSLSSSTCSLTEDKPLSPPRSLLESAHRRSISKSTCSLEKIAPRNANGWSSKERDGTRELSLNGFLKEQRIKVEKILNGELDSKAKVVLSGPSHSTSSMVAAICYAWLLENRGRKSIGKDDVEGCIVVPVMNVKRERMWKQEQRQAAWLFRHVGLDATSLLFADELGLENLMMIGQLSILVVGQDVLRTNGEVGSQCTILTDNYCEDAYDLLERPVLKKLLLSGILLDTQNLNVSARLSVARDAEAVQLLLAGSAPNYRNGLYDQLIQDQRDDSFIEAMRHNYGKPPNEDMKNKIPERKSTSVSPNEALIRNSDKNSNNGRSPKITKASPKPVNPDPLPAQAPKASPDSARGKNKSFFAKLFGFRSK